MSVDLRRAWKCFNKTFLPLVGDQHRVQAIVGGASSGKSYDIAMKIVLRTMTQSGHRYLVVRKVARTIRHSCFDLLIGIMGDWSVTQLYIIRRGELEITNKITGSSIIFAGLDDVEKLKSIYGITDIWVEEASETTEGDFNQLDLRLRGPSQYKKQIMLTCNPISALHWIKARFFDREEHDTITHRSTYKDNRFLDQDTRERLEAITDPYFKRVYVDGEWGIYENVVFTNIMIHDFEFGPDDMENVSTGMDFGFAHANALERVGFKDGNIWSFDELHGRGWTNREFIAYAQEQWGEDLFDFEITADSASPDHIKEWADSGYRVTGAKKGDGSLRFGVDYLASHRWHIHATKCPALAREVQAFKRREDKDGNTLDRFVEMNDDGIAACRYATEWIWAQSHGTIGEYGNALDALGL